MMTFGGYLNNITNIANGDVDPFSQGSKCKFQIYGIGWDVANPAIKLLDPETGTFINMGLKEIRVYVPAIEKAFVFRLPGSWYANTTVTVFQIAEDEEVKGIWHIPHDTQAIDWFSIEEEIPEEFKEALLASLDL